MAEVAPLTSPPAEATPTPGEPKVCRVCGEEIAKYKGLHYGGLTCYSCRAFFRRCHSADRKEPFRAACKDQNSCLVTVKNRRKCPSCRYDRCLNAGMKPELVLTQEEKEERFKKFFQKRALLGPTGPQNHVAKTANPTERRRAGGGGGGGGQKKRQRRRTKKADAVVAAEGSMVVDVPPPPPVPSVSQVHPMPALPQVPLPLEATPVQSSSPTSSSSQPSPPAIAVKSKAPPPQIAMALKALVPNGAGVVGGKTAVVATTATGQVVNGNGQTDANLMELCLSDVNNILKDCEGNIVHPQHLVLQQQQQQQQTAVRHVTPTAVLPTVPVATVVQQQQQPVFLQQAAPPAPNAQPRFAAPVTAAVVSAGAATTVTGTAPTTDTTPISYVVAAAPAASAIQVAGGTEWGPQRYILEKL